MLFLPFRLRKFPKKIWCRRHAAQGPPTTEAFLDDEVVARDEGPTRVEAASSPNTIPSPDITYTVITSLLCPDCRFSAISRADVKRFFIERYSNDISNHWVWIAQTFPYHSIQMVLENLHNTRKNHKDIEVPNRDQQDLFLGVDLEFVRKAQTLELKSLVKKTKTVSTAERQKQDMGALEEIIERRLELEYHVDHDAWRIESVESSES